MSCFLVSAATIDVLVNAAAEFGVDTDGLNPRELGEMLWRENCASYTHRYAHCLEDSEREAMAETYRLTTTEAPLHPVGVTKAAHCYRYQACEHPGWHTSAAAAFIDRLIAAAEARMPADQLVLVNQYGSRRPRYTTTRLYDDMPAWDVTELDAIAAHRWTTATV